MSPGHRFDCEICGKSFSHSRHRDRHVASVHKTGKRLKCPLCPVHNNGRKDNMRTHLRKVHGFLPEHEGTCPVCMLTMSNLLEHMVNDHVMDDVGIFAEDPTMLEQGTVQQSNVQQGSVQQGSIQQGYYGAVMSSLGQ